nr:hypothetical protein [Streptomyces sp. WAC01526]
MRRDLRKLVPDENWPHGPAATAWNPQALELTVLGCLSEAAKPAAGRTNRTPDRPSAVGKLPTNCASTTTITRS